jgi:hypothetical protein
MVKKPAGEIGSVKVTIVDGKPVGGWKKIEYPTNKAEQERQIMTQFLGGMHRKGRVITFVQGDENDFDFKMTEGDTTTDVDLVEVVATDGKGSPYVSREIASKPYAFAELMMNAIRKKARHYGKPTKPLNLLLHATHWRFTPSMTSIALCQHWLQREETCFANIWFFTPLDAIEGEANVLFPIPPKYDTLGGKKPDDFRDSICLSLDPAKAQIVRHPVNDPQP